MQTLHELKKELPYVDEVLFDVKEAAQSVVYGNDGEVNI